MADFNIRVSASELNTAITKANVAAPQSTTYTKSEVDSALAAKITATDYATETTGGTIKAWITTDGSDTILHLATQ